jgi:Family of unknown function (DUF6786)
VRETLIRVLSGVSKHTESYKTPDGSTVLMLPYGGRILGLFAPESEENFFWSNPALASSEAAQAFYESDAWHNSGGDRTWLSPEVDFCFPDFPNLEKYRQPRKLDPGNYKVVKAGDIVRMVDQPTLTLSRSKEEVELEITKWVTPAPNPLRYEQGVGELKGCEYAGYTLHVSLEFAGARTANSARVGIWNLLQMPHGGELLIPTYCRAEPKAFFGTIPPGDLAVDDRLIRYRMIAFGEQKIGIRAVATAGRAGYLYETGGRFALIVRNFSVNPSGEYIDVPWTDIRDLGYSAQACNVHSALGSFSELEYHAPAIEKGAGVPRSQDTSQVWAFRGTREQITRVACSLLSSQV